MSKIGVVPASRQADVDCIDRSRRKAIGPRSGVCLSVFRKRETRKVRRSAGGEPFQVRTVRIPQEPEIDIESFTGSSTDSFILFDEKLNCVGINPAGQ